MKNRETTMENDDEYIELWHTHLHAVSVLVYDTDRESYQVRVYPFLNDIHACFNHKMIQSLY